MAAPQSEKKQKIEPSDENAPMRDYAALIGVFNALLACFLFLDRRSPSSEEVSTGDLLLLGLATQKASRVLARDRVTQPLRAPFTEFDGPGGSGEVEEKARGTGLRKAIGQLVTCPYCLGIWVASGFIYGFAFNPRLTRMVASIFAVSSVADFAQHGYAKAKELTE